MEVLEEVGAIAEPLKQQTDLVFARKSGFLSAQIHFFQ